MELAPIIVGVPVIGNNPLNATDPSGYFVFSLIASLALAGEALSLPTLIATFTFTGAVDAMAAGADFKNALQSGLISGVSAGAFSKVGSALGASRFQGTFAGGLNEVGFALKVVAHGTIGGITSVLQGGKFGSGFASAGFSAAATSFNNKHHIGNPDGPSRLRVVVAAVIGGTSSKLSGGKFANGALTAAMSQALNYESAEMGRRVPISDEERVMIENGDLSGFWNSRYERGDPWAKSGLGLWDPDNPALTWADRIKAGITMRKLKNALFERDARAGKYYLQSYDDEIRDIGIAVAVEHAAYTDLNSGYVPTLSQSNAYHFEIFVGAGLAEDTYGGTPLGYDREGWRKEFGDRQSRVINFFVGYCEPDCVP